MSILTAHKAPTTAPAHTPGSATQAPLGPRFPRGARARRSLRRVLSPGVIVSAAILLLVLGWAIAPGLFAHSNPLIGEPKYRLEGPSLAHWFGTDQLGRDAWTRTVYGAGTSLGTTALAVLVAFVVGAAAGLIAGWAGGVTDSVIMRIVDVAQSIPSLLLSMAVVTALGFGPGAIALAVAVSSSPAFARITRGEVLRWRSTLFVEAARLSGISTTRTVLRHVVPHVAGPVFALAAVEFGAAVLAVSALSFLGYGAPPPQPEWGLLVSDGRDYLASAWWLTALPGLVIAATVLSVNHIARHFNTERRPA